MPDPIFRFVCVPAALDGMDDGWAADLLSEGELALLAGPDGLDGVNGVAQALDAVTVSLVRAESTPAAQERTVISYASAMPLVWVAKDFSEDARKWAHARGPMTLLVEAGGALPEEERRRITRFVALLGRQAE